MEENHRGYSSRSSSSSVPSPAGFDDLLVINLKENSKPLDQVQGAVRTSLAEKDLCITLVDALGQPVRTNEELQHALARAGGAPLKALPSDSAAQRLSEGEEKLQALRERLSLEKLVLLEQRLDKIQADLDKRIDDMTAEVAGHVTRMVLERPELRAARAMLESDERSAGNKVGTSNHRQRSPTSASDDLSRLRGEVTSRLATLETESAAHTEEVGRWAVSYSMLARRLDEHDAALSTLRAGSQIDQPDGPQWLSEAQWVNEEHEDVSSRRPSPVRVQPPDRHLPLTSSKQQLSSSSSAALHRQLSKPTPFLGEVVTPRDACGNLPRATSSACIGPRVQLSGGTQPIPQRTAAAGSACPVNLASPISSSSHWGTEDLATSRSTPLLQASRSRSAISPSPASMVTRQVSVTSIAAPPSTHGGVSYSQPSSARVLRQSSLSGAAPPARGPGSQQQGNSLLAAQTRTGTPTRARAQILRVT